MIKCWEWHNAIATYSIEEKLQRSFQLAQIFFIGNGALLRSPYLDESVLFFLSLLFIYDVCLSVFLYFIDILSLTRP